ncbi:MAG TPA: hypothetical protein VF668_01410 [Pyrinomonadaceae bacterium]|jgi:hypothetical protein
MNCLHCEEPLCPLDPDVLPVNGGDAGMHRECLLRGVIGSADHIRRGPHPAGACLPDDPRLTKREAARAAVRAYFEREQNAA